MNDKVYVAKHQATLFSVALSSSLELHRCVIIAGYGRAGRSW
jgi:hypothetical protein